MTEEKYKRLTRERAPRQISLVTLSRSSLWLGSDHLLFVECTGYTESYKRFYFRDIQAITIRQTKLWWLWIALLALPFLLFAIGLSFGVVSIATQGLKSNDLPVMIALGIPAAFFLLFLILNFFWGPSCRVQLRTAVQTEELGSISRVRQARRILNRIRPLIVEAQGQLTPEEVSVRMQEAARPAAAPQAAMYTASDVPPVIT
jgi:hypothetical protein